ncbi:PDZ domain-containing protein [Gorillibacterium massiliense]|uniref:PDZ domain-containing protein n=1 Tax=Gorillibacterium massiliense TaxID=1280390 RepID=UPI0004BC045C|nr:PDZ domain-containing protein [Gorillibacterium massiliense]
MEIVELWLERLLWALVRLALNPFYYLGILFIVLQYRRQIALERRLFAVKLRSLVAETGRTWLWGLLAGAVASILMTGTGIRLQPETVLLLWAITFVLLFFRIRHLCLAYAAGILGIIHGILSYIPAWDKTEGIDWLHRAVDGADLPSLFILVGVLHLLEGVLLRYQGHRMASPLFVESRRGKIIGGYQLQGFWPIPLFLLAPLSGGDLHPAWEPLFSGNWQATGWDFLVFPAVIGFSQMNFAHLPKVKLRQSSGLLFGYAAIMIAGAVLTYFWDGAGLLIGLLSIVLHEAIVWIGSHLDAGRRPLFVNDERGLKILAVIPGSAAEEAGLTAGEIVHRVNGEQVRTKEEMHLAMRLNSAFCKLEVLNLEGHSKFINRPLFAGQHHQLGLVLCPDDQAPFYVTEKPFSLLAFMRKKKLGLIRNDNETGIDL